MNSKDISINTTPETLAERCDKIILETLRKEKEVFEKIVNFTFEQIESGIITFVTTSSNIHKEYIVETKLYDESLSYDKNILAEIKDKLKSLGFIISSAYYGSDCILKLESKTLDIRIDFFTKQFKISIKLKS